MYFGICRVFASMLRLLLCWFEQVWLRHNWANSISLVEEKLFCFSVSLCIRLVVFPKDYFDIILRNIESDLSTLVKVSIFPFCAVIFHWNCPKQMFITILIVLSSVWANDPVAWRIFLVYIHLKSYMCWRQQFGFSGNSIEGIITHTYLEPFWRYWYIEPPFSVNWISFRFYNTFLY